MKRILGLDLGTNSIGWALVNEDERKIEGLGSRIIPMTQDILDTFSGGKPLETQTAAPTIVECAAFVNDICYDAKDFTVY